MFEPRINRRVSFVAIRELEHLAIILPGWSFQKIESDALEIILDADRQAEKSVDFLVLLISPCIRLSRRVSISGVFCETLGSSPGFFTAIIKCGSSRDPTTLFFG